MNNDPTTSALADLLALVLVLAVMMVGRSAPPPARRLAGQVPRERGRGRGVAISRTLPG